MCPRRNRRMWETDGGPRKRGHTNGNGKRVILRPSKKCILRLERDEQWFQRFVQRDTS